jgi:histidine triad (HIT) family protein
MDRDPNCVFCRIAQHEIPAQAVLETDQVLAFLDIRPLAEGHLLLIPKAHVTALDEMSPEAAGQLCAHLPELGSALRRVTSAAGYNVLQNNGRAAGQEVTHVHIHLIPRTAGDGLGYRWLPQKYPEGKIEQLRDRLRSALSG